MEGLIKMYNNDDMLVREDKVVIGVREFKIQEMTCPKRSTILNLVFGIKLPDIIKVISEKLSGLNVPGREANVKDLFSLLASNPGVWQTLIMSTINSLNLLPTIIVLSLVGEVTEEDELYVRNNLTMRQEVAILNTVYELNDFTSIIKNAKSLLLKLNILKN